LFLSLIEVESQVEHGKIDSKQGCIAAIPAAIARQLSKATILQYWFDS